MKIEHIALNVGNATEQVKWYVEHLGMQIVRQQNDRNQTHFIADDSGQMMIELYTNPDVPLPAYATMEPRELHIAFSVTDMVSERNRLIAAGATAAGDIEETVAGDFLAMLRDPWGVTLQLAQRKNPMIPL